MQPEAPRHFGYYQPALAGRNAAIAQAAANAGFDTSNTRALTSLISSVKDANRAYKAREVYPIAAAYEDRDYDTRVINRTPRGRSITRVYPDKWSSSTVQPISAVRTRDASHGRFSNSSMNIEAHDAGVERAFDHIMNMEVCDTGSRAISEHLTYVKASRTSVERARGHYVEDSYDSGVIGVGDIDMDTGAYHPTTERASDYPMADKVLESSGDRPSDLPIRALLREQEDREQQPPSFSFPQTLDKTSQDVLTRITQAAPSGANNEPLGSVVRKRSAPEAEEASRASKFRMMEDVAPTNSTAVHDGILIDLTIPDKYVPPHRRHPVLSNITNTQKTGCTATSRTNNNGGTTTNLSWNRPDKSGKGSKKVRRQHAAATAASTASHAEPTDQNVSRRKIASQVTFNTVFNRLSMFRKGLINDREALSNCWEVDDKMKEPEMMDRMQDLGEYMKQIDKALAGAIGIVSQIK
ncbi:hypothetical protein MMC27_001681 [Xylographa pallens]|nr:hypothetical protein [Xylographa pallens]